RERQVGRQRRVAPVEFADLEIHAHPELVAGRARRDVDRAAVRVTAEQRALRPAQDLDALDFGEVRLEETVARLPHAVDVDTDTGQAANEELPGAGAGASRIGDEVRHHDAQVGAALQTAETELFAGEGLNRDRRALQIGLAALRRDDDLLQLGERAQWQHRHRHGHAHRAQARHGNTHNYPPSSSDAASPDVASSPRLPNFAN